MSVLHPPIQEEVTIRKNIALGPTGLGQYFPVLSLPLGLGGVIRIHYPEVVEQKIALISQKFQQISNREFLHKLMQRFVCIHKIKSLLFSTTFCFPEI